MHTWQMQEARARMLELVKRAQAQPQDITLHVMRVTRNGKGLTALPVQVFNPWPH